MLLLVLLLALVTLSFEADQEERGADAEEEAHCPLRAVIRKGAGREACDKWQA
jgi:hypothetical protein